MSRPLSPIERMVDEATGHVPAKPASQPRQERRELLFNAIGQAMLAVCDAAEVWHRDPTKRAGQKRLGLAVAAYQKLIK